MTAKINRDADGKCGEVTTQPLTAPAANGAETSSDWLRLPRPKTRLWGLSRTTWIELLDNGQVKGLTLRKRHAQRGIRLIFRPSADAYLRSLMDGEAKESKEEAPA